MGENNTLDYSISICSKKYSAFKFKLVISRPLWMKKIKKIKRYNNFGTFHISPLYCSYAVICSFSSLRAVLEEASGKG